MRRRVLLTVGGLVGGAALLVLGLVLASGLYLAPAVSAQTRNTPTPVADEEVELISAPADVGMPRSITVVGEGKVSVTPDIAQATIGVETVAETVREATNESAETMEAVLEALVEAGVAERDIQTSGYSIWSDRQMAMLDSRMGAASNEGVVYRVTNQVAVTIRDLDTVGEVLDAAIEAGANNMYGVNYTVEDPEEYTAEAREAAVENALAKANELAELNGVEVGQVVSVSEVVGNAIPYARGVAMEMAAGAGAGPFQPGEMEIGVQLQIVYAIQ